MRRPLAAVTATAAPTRRDEAANATGDRDRAGKEPAWSRWFGRRAANRQGQDIVGEPWLVVGLGNPGPAYAGHRHNLGAMVVDLLGARLGAGFKAHKGRADVASGVVSGERVLLMKPRSYMNLSGGPTAAVRDFYKVPLDRVVAVHDELDLPFGAIRVKLGGGSSHNGVRSLAASLGDPGFLRVRVGVGRPPGRMDGASYVLHDFDAAERRDLGVELERAADAVESLLTQGLTATQNAYHGSA
jgi:PTH1 family peptidyl-tRNA hydrolase